MEILTDKARLSLYKKSSISGISTGILEEVYRRGFESWDETLDCTPEQLGFDRVNSFIAGGFAAQLDEDLKKACWKGYEAVGMKKKNGKTVPNCVPTKESYTGAEKTSNDSDDPASRFIGTDNLTKTYKNDTPGEKTISVVKKVVRENINEDWQKVNRQDKTDGLSQKAVDAYRREHPGSKLKTAVTEKNPSGKRASRRKNFCSRMGGMKKRLTSAETARDPDSRINKALRRWHCREEAQNEAVMAPPPVAQGPSVAERPAVRRSAPSGQQRLQGNTYRAGQSFQTRTATPTSRLSGQGGSWNASVQTQKAPTSTSLKTSGTTTGRLAGQGGTLKPTATNASPKTQTATTSSAPSGGKAPAPSAPSTKAITPKGADIVKSGTKGLGKLAGKAAGAAGAVALAYDASKKISANYKDQHSGGIIPHEKTPGVSTKDSFARMKNMKAPAANSNPTPSTGKIEVGEPKKISGQYKGKVGDTTVAKGQTLSGIAKQKGTTVGDIMSKNAITNPNKVRAGSKLFTGDVPTPPKRTNEETVNELSPETLGNYITGAEKEMTKIKAKDPMNTTFADTEKFYKRKAGVDLAKNKKGDE